MDTCTRPIGQPPAPSAAYCASCLSCSSFCPRCETPAPDAERVELNFNLGWSFLYLERDDATDACTFETSLAGQTCSGLELDTHRFEARDCREACCHDARCLWWQHRTVPPMCWLGYADHPTAVTCVAQQPGETPRTGGHRAHGAPAPTSTLYAAATLDASAASAAWERVDLPHDFVATHGTLTPSEDPTRGYLTRGVGWYRKRFRLPAAWAVGASVWIRFEAAFNEATVHINVRATLLPRRTR
jgi:hypothetical protein